VILALLALAGTTSTATLTASTATTGTVTSTGGGGGISSGTATVIGALIAAAVVLIGGVTRYLIKRYDERRAERKTQRTAAAQQAATALAQAERVHKAATSVAVTLERTARAARDRKPDSFRRAPAQRDAGYSAALRLVHAHADEGLREAVDACERTRSVIDKNAASGTTDVSGWYSDYAETLEQAVQVLRAAAAQLEAQPATAGRPLLRLPATPGPTAATP
jgi:hypothetical protein